jgi:choline dehydrogenase-like flavoprotein
VIVGSALAGLVAGAILTRHRRRVVVLEHADTVGGRGGAVRRPDGWWIDFGHRDGHDVGDCQAAWHHGAVAAREAGVELALRPIAAPLRLHRFPEGAVIDYLDLDECLEWSAYQYVTAPQTASWAWAPVARHALTVPEIRGLLLAGSTLEAPAAIVDLAAWAGLEAARAALALS